MAHSNRKSSRERKNKEKAARKAQNRAYYESLRDSGKNSKRSQRNAKKNKQPGHPHVLPCGNIGCMKDSHAARIGYMKLMTRTHGPDFAIKMAEKRGWKVI